MYFLERDKMEQIYNLTNEYIDIDNTLQNVSNCDKYDNKIECINAINNTKSIIFKHIRLLNRNITIDILENECLVQSLQTKILNEIYLKLLISDINSLSYTLLHNTITHIRDKILILNGHDDSELSNKLDNSYIIQLISNCNITINDICLYGDYIINIINALQAPISVSITNEKWISFKIENESISNSEYIAKMLFFIIFELNDIFDNIENISVLKSIGFI
jgi:hypothetical protein